MFLYYLDLSIRSFKRTPFVSALMVLAIGVGIGITMTSLSVYHMMAMDPFPEKSTQVFHPQLNTMDESEHFWTSDQMPLQLTYKDTMALYESDIQAPKAPSIRTGFSLSLDNSELKPRLQNARATSLEFFDIFNYEFVYGSAWTKQQQDNAEYLTVISEELNLTLFNGENSVGKQIKFDGLAHTVVGVYKDLSSHIKFYDLNNGAFNDHEQVMIPFTLMAALELDNWGNTNGWKYEEFYTYQGKLNSEVFWWQFWIELDSQEKVNEFKDYLFNYLDEQGQLGRFERESPKFELRNIQQWLDYRNVVSEDNKVLVALSFMFLAVCLANILGLLLGKFMRRAPDVGVMRALGASKTQVFFQHIVEVSFLGVIGGVIGIALAQLGLWGVRSTYSYFDNLASMDMYMLFSAPVISISACILAGLYPAWVICRTKPAISLKTQ